MDKKKNLLSDDIPVSDRGSVAMDKKDLNLKSSAAFNKMEEIEDQLHLSNVKQQHWKDKIEMLEIEKQRIEQNSELLKQERDKESVEWKARVNQMQREHDSVVKNLQNVNSQYMMQIEENESLKSQLE